MVYFDQILLCLLIHFNNVWPLVPMQNGVEALPKYSTAASPNLRSPRFVHITVSSFVLTFTIQYNKHSSIQKENAGRGTCVRACACGLGFVDDIIIDIKQIHYSVNLIFLSFEIKDSIVELSNH